MMRYLSLALLSMFCCGLAISNSAPAAQGEGDLQDVKSTQATVADEQAAGASQQQFVVYDGTQGSNARADAKHIVLVSGDEEYRSEEALPALAKILAVTHGFKCTVLFAVDPATGEINPNVNNNIPGLEALREADLMVIFTRYRNLPDEQMKYIVDYVEAGKPIVAIRTATHAFKIDSSETYKRYSVDGRDWRGGFGKHVLGETWVAHHGQHGRQSTRGILAEGQADHPILRGLSDGDIWGPTDVYRTSLPLPETCQPLVLGQVVKNMTQDGEPVEGEQNSPMMPIAWTNAWESPSGETARVFTSTIGASQDFENEGVRRLLVNACYWALGLDDEISAEKSVDLIGDFAPTPFKFDGYKRGVKPADFALPAEK